MRTSIKQSTKCKQHTVLYMYHVPYQIRVLQITKSINNLLLDQSRLLHKINTPHHRSCYKSAQRDHGSNPSVVARNLTSKPA